MFCQEEQNEDYIVHIMHCINDVILSYAGYRTRCDACKMQYHQTSEQSTDKSCLNEWRLDKIHPSSSLVVDESFGRVSQTPDDMPDALPHTCTQKIIHKPKGVGTQFKDLADGVTGDPGKEG